VRQDRRHSGADVGSFDKRDLSDLHSGDVGDRIQWTGLEDSEYDPRVARAGVLLGFGGAGHREKQEKERGADMHCGIIARSRLNGKRAYSLALG
jgi:hypothetical protein